MQMPAGIESTLNHPYTIYKAWNESKIVSKD